MFVLALSAALAAAGAAAEPPNEQQVLAVCRTYASPRVLGALELSTWSDEHVRALHLALQRQAMLSAGISPQHESLVDGLCAMYLSGAADYSEYTARELRSRRTMQPAPRYSPNLVERPRFARRNP